MDSEHILTGLRADGYQVVPRYDDADLVIVNTCGFINSAVQGSLEAVGEAINDQFDLKSGDIVSVIIEHADEYDLWGTVIQG